MQRSADYTIQGFLYQFNKTALEILRAGDDDSVTIEGIVEDIEVVTPVLQRAIQCKYHEAKNSFSASSVYEPVLQMLKHFSLNKNANIRYTLFVYFPGMSAPFPVLGKEMFKSALASKNKELKKYIDEIPTDVDLDKFQGQFEVEFGPSYEGLAREVGVEFEANGVPAEEIETLVYPNAINLIALLGAMHDPLARQITKRRFLADLMAIRATAISRWTMALKSRAKLLQERKKQLKKHLDQNTRLRYFIIDPKNISDFDAEIVLFFVDYMAKYHFKPAHVSTPILCLCASRAQIQDIQQRLYAKGIVATDGYIGSRYEEAYFFRDPLVSRGGGGKLIREFSLRILSWDDHGDLLNGRKCDDVFVVGEPSCSALETVDVNVERFVGTTLRELKFLLGVSNVYE